VKEYVQRLRGGKPSVEVETTYHKSNANLIRAVEKADHPVLVLDEKGAVLDSLEFANLVFNRLEIGGARLSFIIGAYDGLPKELRGFKPAKGQLQDADETCSRELLSLGRLTLPHRLVRVVLVEQLYRAQEIRQGSKYHVGDP